MVSGAKLQFLYDMVFFRGLDGTGWEVEEGNLSFTFMSDTFIQWQQFGLVSWFSMKTCGRWSHELHPWNGCQQRKKE